MSCSKHEQTYRLSIPREPPATILESLTTYLNHPYYRNTELFSIQDEEGKITFYAMRIWDTMHKKGDVRACAASVWEINCDPSNFNVEHSPATICGTKIVRNHNLSSFARELLACKDKRHLVHGFTSNDPAGFSSFSRGYHYQRCAEYYVMCISKTLMHRKYVLEHSAEKLVNLALTSKFVQPHTLHAILEGLGNDRRFEKNLPPGYKDFSEKEKAQWRESALIEPRNRIREMEPEAFKTKYLESIELNLALDPINTSPEIFKVDVGHGLLMHKEELVVWNSHTGLLFLNATAKVLYHEPYNLRIALSCMDATILEITPDDARYGVKPPNKQRLDFVRTAEGKLWFVGLDKTHGEPQRQFLSELDYMFREALEWATLEKTTVMTKLTKALDEYQFGILGLVKRIYLHRITHPEWFPKEFSQFMHDKLEKLGIPRGLFESGSVQLCATPRAMDSFTLLGHVGQSVY